MKRVFIIGAMSLWLSGCATTAPEYVATPPPQAIPALHGSYYQVGPRETLWRIARSFGVPVETLVSVNRLPSPTAIKVGQRLFIPLPLESRQFFWPVRGSLLSPDTSNGVSIASPEGGLVRAARSGRIAVAARHLSGLGKTVVIDHLDGYLTVYSGLGQILVAPGAPIRQGVPIGSMGSSPLHFEIRYGAVTKNALALLPKAD